MIKVNRTPEVEQRIARLRGERKCLACELPFEQGTKIVCGCCSSCDQTQRHCMRKGVITLRELIAAGERLPASKGGRKPATEYAARLLGRGGGTA